MSKDISMKIKMGSKSFKGIKTLSEGGSIDESQILELCEFVDQRYDCADFRLITLLRVLYDYKHLITKKTISRLEESIFKFKYWMDEPGDDSMCYWSENHQLLFFTCQYLAGQYAPEKKFENSGYSGRDMVQISKVRLLRWLERRYTYGFVEWHSNTYYEEDIAPLSNLIDFCNDAEIVQKSKMIMDLILLDMAMHGYKGLLVASSGRCYEDQKKYPLEQDTLEIMETLSGYKNINTYDYERISSNFHLRKRYEIPDLIRMIAKDESDVVIKTSMGLNLKEVKNELGSQMDIENVGYYLWAMESFTNPEGVRSTMNIFNQFKMNENIFLKDLAVLKHKWLNPVLPLVTKILNPATHGVAIQRANTYTYKTKDYLLSTAQNYHPGTFGDQQHIWQATLSKDVPVFTTHPAKALFEDNSRNFSPSYWVGSGILPHSVQDKNMCMSIYKVNQRKGLLEGDRLHYTHAYFPKDLMDEVVHDDCYIFGRLGDTYIALIGLNPLIFNKKDSSDLIQEGKVTYWICQIENKGSFKDFITATKKKKITFNQMTLTYESDQLYALKYKGAFKINTEIQNLEYERLESPYGMVKRKDENMIYSFKDQSLELNFNKQLRHLL